MFERGQTYYRITYADPKMTMPGIEPMVYLGTNVFPWSDKDKLVHYFQDTVSVMKSGYADSESESLKHVDGSNIRVYPVEDEHTSSTVDILAMAKIVEEAASRAQRFNFPVVAPNSWRDSN